jgi:CheY-like chemotaxis protein
LGGVRVLVVEDDADARALAARVLTGYGATVTTVASAEAGLAALTRPGESVPDVLLSDIGMPGTDGYELIRQVRRLPGRAGVVPAAAVTAFARGEDRRQALLAGFQAHVTKPLDPTALAATVAALAGRTESPAPGASGSAHARAGSEDGAGAS